MSYLLFFVAGYFVMWISAKYGLSAPSDTDAIVIAILSGCEAIAWRCRK